ncbi:glutathione S-transferase [Rhizobium petrolearium]|jgi:glutathione S-transferase|uniref:Glutathione S-transferase C-terminal domain-containing protein n=2 Tax=Neorhizobium TaxID=1525371 RepID=A0ABV0MAR0_9HYPH|nr:MULTISPECIES: glutathione S-transferase C-terminal domain-containing protein [Hyphomicrobiales]MBP1847311.1 glutathione S-transferase [Neorhizobium petrolearium]MCC2614350.1 glutathione S-transferase C-terminal domain-containing protein [Neorhizobium petrolearium]WGI72451.1 glutathione S-transferase C-terminal domain-containing protein [Neorhizobium petrolearium]|tara:strand:+ start:25 stop:627 length:603 start_codon:yes stop_codon:yes gene_type:complete
MMELYYMPAACSLAAHISCLEAGLPVTCRMVVMDPSGNKVEGEDYTKINPLGLVPTIVDGETRLSEVAVVLQYIADKADGKLGKVTGEERWKLLETLNFIATEIHKSLAPLFRADLPAEARPFFEKMATGRLIEAQNRIGDAGYLVGDSFTVADAYLFTVLGWCNFLKMDMSLWPKLGEYARRIGGRPSVQQALKEEGLA